MEQQIVGIEGIYGGACAEVTAELRAVETGLKYHAARQWKEAALEYEKSLKQNPDNAEALLLLGILAMETGQPKAAVDLLGKAVMLRPETPHFRMNLGRALGMAGEAKTAEECLRKTLESIPDSAETYKYLGDALAHQQRHEEAYTCYAKALQLKPQYADAMLSRGYLLCQEQRLEEAAICYEEVLRWMPRNVDVLVNLGVVKQQMQRYEEAIDLFRKVLDEDALHSKAWYLLANAMRQMGKLEQAVLQYRTALLVDAKNPNIYNNLGTALSEMGKYADAQRYLKAGLELEPENYLLLLNLGNAYLNNNQVEEAEEFFCKVLALKPDLPEIHNSLGSLLLQKDKLEAAWNCFQKALELRPRYAEAMANLGTVELRNARPDRAVGYIERAIEWKPACYGARYNLGLQQLLSGDMERGWGGYEWRWQYSQAGAEWKKWSQPFWKGEELKGARILVHAEQGLGDTLQFIRYVPMVALRGGQVILMLQPRLRKLLERTPGAQEILSWGDAGVPFDCHIPMMSMPWVFGTRLDSVPWEGPYVKAVSEEVAHQKHLWPGTGLRVGLAWGGNPKNRYNLRRAIPLKMLERLKNIPGVSFFSLQRGDGHEQLAQVQSRWPIADACAEHEDMSETAALMATLDLVITVDTSIAHLAGAMGRPVWILLPFSPDWRWMLSRTDTPWYPTAKLFRQAAPENWESAVEHVEDELRMLASRHALEERGILLPEEVPGSSGSGFCTAF